MVEGVTIRRITGADSDENAIKTAADLFLAADSDLAKFILKNGCNSTKPGQRFVDLLQALAKDAANGALLYVAEIESKATSDKTSDKGADGKTSNESSNQSSKTVVGCLLAWGPKATPTGDNKQADKNYQSFVSSLATTNLKNFWEKLLPAVGYVLDELIGDGGEPYAWTLSIFVVTSDYRRKGIGKALLAKVSEKGSMYCAMTALEPNFSAAMHMNFHVHKLVGPIPTITSNSFAIIRKGDS